jgi:hypothetical protein
LTTDRQEPTTTQLTDAVEKRCAARGFAVGVRFRVNPGWA